jgi:hypothetical protein
MKSLKEEARWLVWKYEQREGKETKVPYNPNTHKRADGTKFENCVPYFQAEKVANENGYAGVGIILGDGLFGVDLDKCVKDGSLNTAASEIVKALNSYTERSPSKDGLHILGLGKKPGDRCRRGDIECYDEKRWFTFTGNHLAGTPTEVFERNPELIDFYYKTWPKEKNKPEPQGQVSMSFDGGVDVLTVEAETFSDKKLKLLWAGDWSDHPSQSEADLSLCNHLVRLLGPDPARIDAAFRKSGLYREKWDRYGAATIEKALDGSGFPDKDHPAWEGHEPEPEKPHLEIVPIPEEEPEEEVPEFPEWVMAGLAGDFARLYSEYLEVPEHFFYMAFLTCLGALVSEKISLASELQPQLRLFLLLLGESALVRKSTAVDKTVDFFTWAAPSFPCSRGVNSAAGLQQYFRRTNSLLLALDEFKHLLTKCKREGSVLISAVGSLYESNRYESRTQGLHVRIEKAHLSLLAASTIDTYQNTWESSFTDIGFSNRLWLLPGAGERVHALPIPIPDREKYDLKQRLREVVENLPEEDYQITTEAREAYQEWYINRDSSIHSRRLGGYSLRLMGLITVNEQKEVVDLETVQKVIALADYQLEVRQQYDPIDAEGQVARMEERVRRAMKKQSPRSTAKLKRAVNASRYGQWIFTNACENLVKGKELKHNHREGIWTRISQN